MITLNNVSLSLGGPALLDGVELRIVKGERICLLGRNGEGKSTLLEVLSGTITPDDGEVVRARDLRVGVLPQQVPTDVSGSVFTVVAEGLGVVAAVSADPGWERRHEVAEACTRANVPPATDFAELSTGLQRRVLLARAFVDDPGLLLLDEPTNHLDIEAIAWLESTLGRFKGAVVFVTHDRALLRRFAGRIIELDRGRLRDWTCDYDTFIRRRDDDLRVEAAQQAQFDRVLAQEEIWIRQGVRERRTRNEGRVRELLHMREERRQRRQPRDQASFQVQEGDRSGKLVFRAEDVHFDYAQKQVLKSFSTSVLRGDKIGIVGPNGCGKTTLVKLLLGDLEPSGGIIKRGGNLQVVYFDQRRALLDDTQSVQQNVTGGPDTVRFQGRDVHLVSYLKMFLFTRERIHTPITHLSGGERNRLLLAKLFTQPANVLVLDEPTNDLDLETLELLEELLLDYEGTLLLVSHDREFLDNVVTSTLVFTGDGAVQESVGGWRDWERALTAAVLTPVPQRKQRERNRSSAQPRSLSWREERELEALPARIEAAEQQQQELHERLADPELYRSAGTDIPALKARLEELEAELETWYRRWEELEEIRSTNQ